MTSSSKSVNVCGSTLEIAYRRTLLQLYVGRRTVTWGFTRTAYFQPLLSVPDVQDVAIFNLVGLPFQAPVAGFLRLRERSSRGDEVVVVHDLRANQLRHVVGVDDARRFLRRHPGTHPPCTPLILI